MQQVRETNFEILSNFSDEPLERQLADQKLSGFLVPPDFTECDSARTESVGLLDASSSSGLMRRGEQTMEMVRLEFLTATLLRVCLVASCLRGALPPVVLRAVCYHFQKR